MTHLVSIALAFSLLATDAQVKAPIRQEFFALVRREVVRIALASELMDEREVRYVMSDIKEFESDLTMLRRRVATLRYAPMIADHLRFVQPREITGDLVLFNRGYKAHLEKLAVLYPSHEWIHSAIEENDRLYRAWDLLRDGKCEYYYTHIRRQSLAQLRDIIGLEAFNSGIMPPHVPFWRFTQLRASP